MGGFSTSTLSAGRGWLRSDAAKSLERIDGEIGHPLQVTEAGRTWTQQKAHWDTYQRVGYPIALHPDTPSIHQLGAAIDTDERITTVLNRHGWFHTVFRNGVLVEPWHYEYDPQRDKHFGEEPDMPLSNDDIEKIAQKTAHTVWAWNSRFKGRNMADIVRAVFSAVTPGISGVKHHGDTFNEIRAARVAAEANEAALKALATAQGADPEQIAKIVSDAVDKKMDGLSVTITVDSES